MRIYNYLFYKTFLLAKRSGNFKEMPVLGGLLFVCLCVMFNLFSAILLLEEFGLQSGFEINKEYKFIFSSSLILLLLFYYNYKSRYKKIIEYYEKKKERIYLPPFLVIIIYYGISSGLLLLVGLYIHHKWIFAQ